MRIFFNQTPIGAIGIAEECGSITHLFFDTDVPPQGGEQLESALIKEAFRQLSAYLTGQLKEFSLPLAPSGTDFMQSVWRAIIAVPYGQTTSYKTIASAIANPKAVRAVGMANNRNPIPIFIPCHRIIGVNGKLVGYRGGLALKEKLLLLESSY